MTLRILLADDHIVVRRGLRALLETNPDFVVCAEADNGRQAVELAIEHKPEVAVIDISMPVLNGVEATRQIRIAAPATEILVFTMHDSDELISEVLRAGARGYLLKSDCDNHVIDAVATLARHLPFFSSQVSEALLASFNSGLPVGHANFLTTREREVVQLIAEGNSNKTAAFLLDVSIKTIETHRSSAMRKLGMRSTAEMVRYAVRNKLVEA
jgi:DNA-binding NarL/FixJ family response regulator